MTLDPAQRHTRGSPTPVDLSMVDLAVQHARRGWFVHPLVWIEHGRCSCGNADCGSAGKHPLTAHGFRDATRDEAEIRRWWTRWPQANVGGRTGAASGAIVLDIDPRSGGDDSLFRLEAEYGELPETPAAITGSGGAHRFFRHPGHPVGCSESEIGAGLDIKGDGGYVVLPGSLHASGRRYAWDVGAHPDDIPLAEPPPWLLRLMGDRRRQNGPTPIPEPIPTGQRRRHFTSLVGSLRARHVPEDVILSCLRVVNERHCAEPSPDADLVALVRSTSAWDPEPEALEVARAAERHGLEEIARPASTAAHNSHDSTPGFYSAAVRSSATAETNIFRFRTAAELTADTPAEPAWLWRGYLVAEGLTILGGREKRGKSTLIFALLPHLLQGAPFLGAPTAATRIVFLSEEPAGTVREKLVRFGLSDAAEGLSILTRWAGPRPPLTAIVGAAVAEAQRVGAGLIVVDTLAYWSALPADAENDSGAMLAALNPLLDATSRGLAVLALHNLSRGREELRGSTALGAAADILLTLHAERDTPARRRLEGVGRYQSTPESMLLELQGDDYVALGTPGEVGAEGRREQVMAALPSDGVGLTVDELSAATGLDRRRLGEALESLAGEVERTGEGKRGSAFRYRQLAPSFYSAAAPSYTTAEKKRTPGVAHQTPEDAQHVQLRGADVERLRI